MPLIGHWPLQEKQEVNGTPYTVRSGSPDILPSQSRIENLRSTESGTDNFAEFTFDSTKTRDFEFRYELANYTNGVSQYGGGTDRYHGIVEFFDSDGNVMFAVSVYAQDFHIWDTQSTNYDYSTIRDNSYDTGISPSGDSHNIKITWDGSAWKVDIDNGAYTRTMTAMNSPVKRIWTGSEGTSDSYLNGTHEFNLEDLNQGILYGIAYDVVGINNGTNNGATVGANGILGTSAYDFEGSDEWIDISNNAFPTSIQSGYTISQWSYIPSSVFDTGENYTGFCMYGQHQIRLKFDDNNFTNSLAFAHDDGSLKRVNHVIDSGGWYHQVGVFDGSNIRLFINGIERDSQAAGSPSSRNDENAIGSYDGSNQFWDGRIADVRIYDHALTPAEVQYLYEVSRRGRFVSSKWRK